MRCYGKKSCGFKLSNKDFIDTSASNNTRCYQENTRLYL
jgi:hypothetical protein